MSDLTPCPSCRRHVSANDAACPFCGAQVEPVARASLVGRHTRAAVFASATLLAAGCGKKQPIANQGSDTVGSASSGSSVETTATPDAATPDAEVTKTPQTIEAVPDMPYGAPPARRRRV